VLVGHLLLLRLVYQFCMTPVYELFEVVEHDIMIYRCDNIEYFGVGTEVSQSNQMPTLTTPCTRL
jgi:hypothetical protein